MDIFILRHGSAEPSADKDRNRRLTEEGRADLRHVLGEAKTELQSVEAVFASPFVRTQQTAELALSFLDPSKSLSVQTYDELIPGGYPQLVIDWLAQQSFKAVLLVSHQPFIGALLDEIGGFEPGRYRMGTSALAFFQAETVAAGLGHLNWLKQP